MAIFTIVKWDLVFSTLVDQDTKSDEEFEDIFFHQSSKEYYAEIMLQFWLFWHSFTILLSIEKYFGKSICTLLHCIEK